jgi:protein-ribulosamine 3-kinase
MPLSSIITNQKQIATGDRGRAMMHGEYESMREICKVSPSFAPRPICWGSCAEEHGRHYLLLEFHDLKSGPPSPTDFARELAKLHRESSSPNGMFGFHLTTYNGNLPQDNTWTKSWETFFSNGIRSMLALEEEARGPSKELQELLGDLLEKVIPRLLRPLESHGRAVKPSLLHGDLWVGNAATDKATGQPVIFDSSAYYGHHECQFLFPKRETFFQLTLQMS